MTEQLKTFDRADREAYYAKIYGALSWDLAVELVREEEREFNQQQQQKQQREAEEKKQGSSASGN